MLDSTNPAPPPTAPVQAPERPYVPHTRAATLAHAEPLRDATCERCGTPFVVRRGAPWQRFCSARCRRQAHRAHTTTPRQESEKE